MTTRAQLEKKLLTAAEALGLTGERRRAYVYGTLDKVFARKQQIEERIKAMRAGLKRKSPKELRVKAPNPLRRARAARRKNPVTPHHSTRQMNVIRAIQLFQRFRVQEPKFVEEVSTTFHTEMMAVGKCVAIEYDTVRKGKVERYRHEFTGKSKPVLAASYDGSQLYFLKGQYDFTDRGIVDRK